MVELADIRARWISERDKYKCFCEHVKDLLGPQIRKRGVYSEIEFREKDLASLLKKALHKGYRDPYEEIRDKAGVRVVVRFLTDVGKVEEAIGQTFAVCKREDKSDIMDYNEFGYLGIHYEVQLQESHLADYSAFR